MMRSVRALLVGGLISSAVLVVVSFAVTGEGNAALAASAKLGVLQIKIDGLPSSAKPSFQVNGPSLKTTVVGPVKLKNLSAGRYAVRGRAFYSKDTKYVPSPVAAVQVKGKNVVVARVRFTSVKIKSSLTIKVSAAPDGKRPSVLVRGPKGFTKRITSTTKFDAVFPGKYSVTSVEVISGRLVYVPGVSDPNPQVLPGETTTIRIGWKSARDKNLVVVPEGVLLTTPVLVNGQGVLEVSDVTGIDIGDPLLLPATDTTPQSLVKVVSINGKQLVVKASSIYEVLPKVNYEYHATEEPLGDFANFGVKASSENSFGGLTPEFRCSTTGAGGTESGDWRQIVGKITPFLKVKTAVLKWDFKSWRLFLGPEIVELILTAGIERTAVVDLSVSLKRSCKGSVEVAYPLPNPMGIPFYVRGEFGLEVGLEGKFMLDSNVETTQTFSVDMGVKYENGALRPVYEEDLDFGFGGSQVGDWNLEGSLTGEAGFFAGLFLSFFESPKKVDLRVIKAIADLKVGITTSLGIGADFAIKRPSFANPTGLTVQGTPYIYNTTSFELVATAGGEIDLGVWTEDASLDLRKTVDLVSGKSYFPKKKRSVIFPLNPSKGNGTPTVTTAPSSTTPKRPEPEGTVTSTTQPSASPETTAPTAPASFTAIRAGGPNNEAALSVSALAGGATLVAGSHEGAASFGSMTLTSRGNNDVFVGKVSTSGSWIWVATAGGIGVDYAHSISALSDGSSIVSGEFSGTANFGSTALVSAGSSEVFVAKLSSSGSWLWATSAGAVGSDYSNAVSTLSDGSSMVTGLFFGSAIFGSYTITGSPNNSDIFVAKISSSGEWLWALRAGGSGEDYGKSVAVAADGTALVAGEFGSSAVFGSTTLSSAGAYDVFVAKVSTDGQWLWASKAGGLGGDYATSVAALSDGSSMVTGNYQTSASFGSTVLPTFGIWSTFVAKVSAAGEWMWAKSAGSTVEIYGESIAVLSDGSAVVTGQMRGLASFGSTDVIVPGGRNDMFVSRISSSGDWVYATHAGGAGSVTIGTSVAVMADQSVVVVGRFTAPITFGSTVLQNETMDLFVAKFSPISFF